MRAATANGDDDQPKHPEPTPIRPGADDLQPRGTPPSAPGAGRADLDQAILVLRARVEEEFRISERLDSKSRQAFALAAGFFIVAQTVAFGSFGSVSGAESALVGVCALLAAFAVYVTGHRLASGEDLLEVRDIRPDAIVEWCDAATDDEYVSVRIVGNLRDVAKDRRENNQIRERNYDRIITAMRWSLVFAMVELFFAILVRI
jgi:hypothetical protein